MSPWVRRVARSQARRNVARFASIAGIQAFLVLLAAVLPALPGMGAAKVDQAGLGQLLALVLALVVIFLSFFLVRPARLVVAYALAQASGGSRLFESLRREIDGITNTLIFLGVVIVTYRLLENGHLLAAVTGAPEIDGAVAVGASCCGIAGLGNLLIHAVPMTRRMSRELAETVLPDEEPDDEAPDPRP